MSGPLRNTAILYGACVVLVLAALAYVTTQTLDLERRERRLGDEARWQETVRNALWRLDSAMSPIIVRESARPYFHYRPFYPAERAYTQMGQEILPGDVIMPSPLLCAGESFIKLHFQREFDSTLGSPTVPSGAERERQEAVFCSPERVADAEFSLQALAGLLRQTDLPAMLADASRHRITLAAPPGGALRAEAMPTDAARGPQPGGARQTEARRGTSRGPDASVLNYRESVTDLAARSSNVTRANRNAQSMAAAQNEAATDQLSPSGAIGDTVACGIEIDQSDLVSIWLDGIAGPELLMVRSVSVAGEGFSQGCWFDWPQLRAFLLGQVRDVLPQAELLPLRDVTAVRRSAVAGFPLASISAELLPGPAPTSAVPLWTPVRTALLLGWLVMGVAAVTVARMLLVSTELAERRGRFVTAVTHELRTPLTTFCMYSDLLASGMVKDPQAQQEYLGTLKRESGRLAGIVEDVLAYARLSRTGNARAGPTEARCTLAEVLAQSEPGWRTRAHAGGMTLVVRTHDASGKLITAEATSVERILSNLVDNAVKYAAGCDDPRIILSARTEGSSVLISVRDFGQGVPESERARLFEPFERGAAHESSAIAGLGLGLSIARGMARTCGGELRCLVAAPADETTQSRAGACFELAMPIVKGQ